MYWLNLVSMTDDASYNSEDLVDHDGIAAVIKDDSGRILMQLHVKFGFWTIPVGKVDVGTSVEHGLKKEVSEECGIEINEYKEITSKCFIYDRRGKNVRVDSHIFEIIKYSGVVENKEPNKHSRQEFLTLEQIKTLPYLSDMTLLYLETLGIRRNARLSNDK